MEAPKKVTLANLGGGGLMEDVDREFRNICENIADPNTRTEGSRKINITITVTPDRKGQTAAVAYSVKSTLPGPTPGATTVWIAMDEGQQLGLFAMDLRQNQLPFNPDPTVSEIKPIASNV